MINFDKIPKENKIRLDETIKAIKKITTANTDNMSEKELEKLFKDSLEEAEQTAVTKIKGE